MKITRVHSPSLMGDYFDEATGERYRFRADSMGLPLYSVSKDVPGSRSIPPALSRIAGGSWSAGVTRSRSDEQV
jgi:hypothetical protein